MFRLWLVAMTVGAWLGVAPRLAAAEVPEQPSITAVRLVGSNVQVTVSVPPGLRKVTLESRERLGRGAWEPRAVVRLEGHGGTITVDLPKSEKLEVLRVRADVSEPLPAGFYQGTNRFAVQPAVGGGGVREYGPGVDAGSGAPTASSRTVEESDLWKRRADTLYVFNQYRGLQVLDVTEPDQARLTGTLELPAAGDQMYLLGQHHAILLTHDRCGGDSTTMESEVVIADTSSGAPSIAALVAVPGRMVESRLVGTSLYLASETYLNQQDGSWLWGVVVTAVDLSTPSQPMERDRLWFPGYGQTVAATPEFLFLTTPDVGTAGTSTVHCLDITSPDASTVLYASLPVFGRVPDKFKLDWTGGILRVVSERQEELAGTRTLVTRLETFRLPDPRSAGPLPPAKLGEVELVRGERLFASRFDGSRAYVVTYRVIDPLWIVDLSVPEKPRIAGELHVPGWSTYIQAFGDRLLSVGIDDTDGRRVAVSMFDVTDPSAPALVERISLGDDWSWSEANSDEKAVSILPELGLLLLPYSSPSAVEPGAQPVASRVKLIDFDLATGSLAARGEIPHRFDARRTMVHRERILSLSSSELLSVDASDRDQPVVRHTLALAWSVDRVLLHGPWLIEITTGDSWSGASTPGIRVAPATAPNDDRLAVLLPSGKPILAATVQGDMLYVATGAGDEATTPKEPDAPEETTPNLELRVFELGELPEAMPLVGHGAFAVEPLGWWPQFKPVWVRSDLLVLAGGGNNWWWGWWWWGGPIALDGGSFRYWATESDAGASRLIALDVSSPTTPWLASEVDLNAPDRVQFSPALTANGLVYVSHGTLEPPGPIENPTPGGAPLRPPDWFQLWRQRLSVVDFADATTPTVRRPVEIPGALAALGANGNVLYARGNHWVPNGTWQYDSAEWLDASAYDGVNAHLIASLKLPSEYPHPAQVQNDILWLGRPTSAAGGKSAIESWSLNTEGEFVLIGRLDLPEPAGDLRVVGTLLAAQGGPTTFLVDAAAPESPALVGTYRPGGCLWPNLASAVGDPARGLWFPVGMYGVLQAPRP